MRETTAARRYARALFAEAQAKKQVLACQQGLEELARVARLRDSLPAILRHPFVALKQKQAMIHAALGEYATPLLERFFALLVGKQRFGLLFAILDGFRAEVDRSQNVQAVCVRSAFPLTEPQRRALGERLEGWFQAPVRMQVDVDPGLIGGLVIRTRDQECDQSVRGQLRQMREQFIQP